MTQSEKLYRKIVNNPKDVSFKTLDKVLRQHGFRCRQPQKGSSHYHYYHPDLVEILTIPYNKPIKAVYVKKAISALESLREGSD